MTLYLHAAGALGKEASLGNRDGRYVSLVDSFAVAVSEKDERSVMLRSSDTAGRLALYEVISNALLRQGMRSPPVVKTCRESLGHTCDVARRETGEMREGIVYFYTATYCSIQQEIKFWHYRRNGTWRAHTQAGRQV